MTSDCQPAITRRPNEVRPIRAAAAIGEVSFVTVLTLVGYKAFKIIEPVGFNCSPGLTMIVMAIVMLVVHRRDFASYGVISNCWQFGVTMGVAFSIVLLAGEVIVVALFPIGKLTPTNIPISTAVGVAAIRVPSYVIILFLLTRGAWRRSLERIPVVCSLLLLIVLLIAPPALAIYHSGPTAQVIGLAASLVFCTALGEELFFRGYVQSRLNGVFGRPWRMLGVSFGPGLLIAALLFGLIHVFNPARPFAGHWQVSWLWGAIGVLGGLLYGYMRELTGSIWAATSVHAIGGVYRGISHVFLFK